MADLLTDNLDTRLSLRIPTFTKEQLSEKGIERLLRASCDRLTDVVLPLKTAEIDFEYIQHPPFWG